MRPRNGALNYRQAGLIFEIAMKRTDGQTESHRGGYCKNISLMLHEIRIKSFVVTLYVHAQFECGGSGMKCSCDLQESHERFPAE